MNGLSLVKKFSRMLTDRQVAILMFLFKHKYFPRLNNPRSLSEKIQYIKLFNRNPLRSLVVDRLKVRNYVAYKSPSCKLVNVLWSGKGFTHEIWDSLPNAFVIKANHGSKMTMVVDKNEHSYKDVFAQSADWLQKDYSALGREWMYRDLEKYLIVEEKLVIDGAVPPDYKFFSFNGRVEMVQVDLARFSSHRRNLYSRDFKKLDAKLAYPDAGNISKPVAYEKALKIAEELSVDFDFIRVDLYLMNDDVFFGELTNTPENGFGKFTPTALDFELGSKLPAIIER